MPSWDLSSTHGPLWTTPGNYFVVGIHQRRNVKAYTSSIPKFKCLIDRGHPWTESVSKLSALKFNHPFEHNNFSSIIVQKFWKGRVMLNYLRVHDHVSSPSNCLLKFGRSVQKYLSQSITL